jgi:hypothetical protein
MKCFKAWSLLALAIGFCAFPFPSMAQQQSDGFLGGQAGGFLQNIFGYGNNQSAGYPGSSANRAPINQNSAPDGRYQGNDDENDDDQDQSGATPNGRLGGGNGQYGSSYAGGQGGYHHGNDGYGNNDSNDSESGGNGQRSGHYGNGGYHRRHHHHHPYRQDGSQGNGNGDPQGRYQNQNSPYGSNQQPNMNNDGNPNY